MGNGILKTFGEDKNLWETRLQHIYISSYENYSKIYREAEQAGRRGGWCWLGKGKQRELGQGREEKEYRGQISDDLSTLSTDAACQLDVFGHDGDTLCMDGTQVSVFKQAH